MIRYAAYDPATGAIVRTGHCQPNDIALQGPCIQSDDADDALHYVSDGKLVPLPPRPSRKHAWRGPSAGWVDPRTASEKMTEEWNAVRAKRDQLLADCDWVVLKYTEVKLDVPEPWRTYRQLLRDITDQPDPQAVKWPEPPA